MALRSRQRVRGSLSLGYAIDPPLRRPLHGSMDPFFTLHSRHDHGRVTNRKKKRREEAKEETSWEGRRKVPFWIRIPWIGTMVVVFFFIYKRFRMDAMWIASWTSPTRTYRGSHVGPSDEALHQMHPAHPPLLEDLAKEPPGQTPADGS